MKDPLLLVDDDPGILRALRWSFEEYSVVTAADRKDALEKLAQHRPAVMTLDLGLPPAPDDATEGLRTLEEVLALAPQTKVIVVTGNGERANAVRAIGLGAYDFYEKPIDAEALKLIVSRAFHLARLEEENRRLERERGSSFFGLVTAHPGMSALCRMAEKVAPTNATVLLRGESGTGKEILARALHDLSPRARHAFVAINCAAIPETLLESELFGHEKGAFTGAVAQVKGKVEVAHKGTLFLDEIGDMPITLQPKLLRFLQARTIERIGGRTPIQVDVRVVCATHRDLQQQIIEGSFREDLYYRVAELELRVPPLRERQGDAVLLAQHFIRHFELEAGKRNLRLSPDAIQALRAHAWPGNVRELENRVRRAVILAEERAISAADLDLAPGPEAEAPLSLRDARQEAERRALLDALAMSNGNLSAVAEMLGISRPTVYSLLKQHGIK